MVDRNVKVVKHWKLPKEFSPLQHVSEGRVYALHATNVLMCSKSKLKASGFGASTAASNRVGIGLRSSLRFQVPEQRAGQSEDPSRTLGQ